MRPVCIALALLVAFSVRLMGQAQNEASIQVPSFAGFIVNNVSAVTPSSPFTIRLNDIKLRGQTKNVRIAVRAMAPDFTPPSGASMPASLVFWTIGTTTNGVGSPGTLNHGAFTNLFTSSHNPKNASVTVQWNLAAPGPVIRAGVHTLTVTWRIEAL